jgi:hypothetical protein
MREKYPNIKVELVGNSGNAFAILGMVSKAMKRADIPEDEISKFKDEAMSGDYDNLLRVCMEWVDVQ